MQLVTTPWGVNPIVGPVGWWGATTPTYTPPSLSAGKSHFVSTCSGFLAVFGGGGVAALPSAPQFDNGQGYYQSVMGNI
ncbi:hypothetical protein FKM82_029091 [Ascaphus truei]